MFDSLQLPVLDSQPNVTALDLQIKTLRDAAVGSIRQMARCVREEATDVKSTVGDIEEWLDRIKQLAEEVCDDEYTTVQLKRSLNCYILLSLRTACQM